MSITSTFEASQLIITYPELIIEYLVLVLVVSYFARKIKKRLDMGREE